MSNAAAKPTPTETAVKPTFSAFSRLRGFLREARSELKTGGLKGLFRRYGWKLFAFVFVYYLVRDIMLYVVIPWLVAKHLIAN